MKSAHFNFYLKTSPQFTKCEVFKANKKTIYIYKCPRSI